VCRERREGAAATDNEEVNNTEHVKNFLSAHQGQFYCNACLSEQAGILDPVQVNQLTRPWRGVKPYRTGPTVCSVCNQERRCIAFE